MVLGTSSGAGKSLMTAALCRVLKRRGEQPLPFKGQGLLATAFEHAAQRRCHQGFAGTTAGAQHH